MQKGYCEETAKRDGEENKTKKTKEEYEIQFQKIPKIFVWVRNSLVSKFVETDRRYFGNGTSVAYWSTSTSKVGSLTQRNLFLNTIVFYEAELPSIEKDDEETLKACSKEPFSISDIR